MPSFPKISPCLWFAGNAEEAVNFYLSLFPASRIIDTLRYGEGAPLPKGTVLTMTFELNGYRMMVINAGPHDTFNDAISLHVACETQEQLDALWNGLISNGGKPVQCVWCKDKFGLSWQVTPVQLPEMLQSGDPEKTGRVMATMMQMVKLDIAKLQAAYDG